MFCHHCGNQAAEGAAFCPNCGTKLITGDAPPQTSTLSQPGPPPLRTSDAPAQPPRKKKTRKLPVILGAAAVVLVLLIALAALGSSGPQTPSGAGSGARQTQAPINSMDVNLSQTYENEAEGIFFQYPSGWVPFDEARIASYADSADNYPLVLLGNEPEDLPEENSYIMVSKHPVAQEKIDHLFVSDEQFAATFDNDVSVKETSLIELDGIPAREITYVTSDGIGYQSYFYGMDSAIYRIDFSWLGESAGNTQRFFDAIIGSYRITPIQYPAEAAMGAYGPEAELPIESNPDFEPEPTYEENPKFYDGNYIDENFEWVESPKWSATSYGGRCITGIVRNKTDKVFHYVQVMFTIYDSNGNQVGSALANTNNLNGSGTWKFEAALLNDPGGQIRFEFAEISAF